MHPQDSRPRAGLREQVDIEQRIPITLPVLLVADGDHAAGPVRLQRRRDPGGIPVEQIPDQQHSGQRSESPDRRRERCRHCDGKGRPPPPAPRGGAIARAAAAVSHTHQDLPPAMTLARFDLARSPSAARHRCIPAYARYGRQAADLAASAVGVAGRPSSAAPGPKNEVPGEQHIAIAEQAHRHVTGGPGSDAGSGHQVGGECQRSCGPAVTINEPSAISAAAPQMANARRRGPAISPGPSSAMAAGVGNRWVSAPSGDGRRSSAASTNLVAAVCAPATDTC